MLDPMAPICNSKGKPREGYTKRSLPMLPTMPALTRIPLQHPDTAVSTPNEQAKVFEKIFDIVTEYNQYLCFSGPSDRNASEEVLATMREINRIGVQAQQDIEAQIERLGLAVREFGSQMRPGELDLRNPAWACKL